MVGRFVQQQKVRRVQQHTQQGIAAALSAGEHSDFLEDVVFGEEKTSQQAAQLGLRGPRRHVAEIVNHAGVGIEFFVLVLGKVVSLNIVSKPELAAGERLRAREQLDEGRFTCSVHTYKCDPVAAFDHETDVAEDLFLSITFRHIFELGHNAAAGLRLREGEVDGRFFRGNLDPLHLLEFLDAALDLLRFCCLVAEPVDEDFQLLDALALVSIRRL